MREAPAHYRLSFLLPEGAEVIDIPANTCSALFYGAGLIVLTGPTREAVLDFTDLCLLAWCRRVRKPCSIVASMRLMTERPMPSGAIYERISILLDKTNAFLPHVAAPPLVPEHPPPATVPASS